MANEEVDCISKALQELEFKSPARTQLALEDRAAPLLYIPRIRRPIVKKPSKNLKEPVIVIQAAQFAIASFKSKKDGEKLPMEIKAPVEDCSFFETFLPISDSGVRRKKFRAVQGRGYGLVGGPGAGSPGRRRIFENLQKNSSGKLQKTLYFGLFCKKFKIMR